MSKPSTILSITEDEISVDNLLQQITTPTTGAAAIFSGTVRGKTNKPVPLTIDHLEYEAYKPMAENKLKQIASEIREKWPSLEGIAIIQRVGKLFPGTRSVLVVCTAAHREAGIFEAARYGIDRIKQIVPVWKKEVGSNGEEWVEGSYRPQPGE